MLKATIVIATLNRDTELAKVISDIRNQTYEGEVEIFATDELGITNAMNTCLKSATGDIIIRVDDDVRLNPNWLKEIVWTFETFDDAGGVTGPTIVPSYLRGNRDLFTFENLPQPLKWVYVNYFQEGNPYALAHMNRSGAFSLGSNFETALKAELQQCDYLESTNYALRTQLVRMHKGWDRKYDGVSEYFEQDMVYKIKKCGWKMYYNPKAYLYHMVDKGGNYAARNDSISRLRNWCRFVYRHRPFIRDFIPLTSYFLFMCAYYVYKMSLNKPKPAQE